ncbi:hypothetical protein MNBD_GAMMA11-1182 [hydrothermal vent metagenome]|uniref:Uncharacterized protein n=1 Tax=hydrothermal vent metagenome TaxID=652676 RepID=A0A3B0WVQ8_9ZZZZ
MRSAGVVKKEVNGPALRVFFDIVRCVHEGVILGEASLTLLVS